MKQAYGIIYKHTNKEKPEKCYIGQTTKSPERRFRKSNIDYRGYKNCKAFYNALLYYTWEGFTTEILCECYSQEELNEKEEFYIKKFNSIAPNGYNLNAIIEGTVVFNDETLKKMSEKRKQYFENLNVIPPGPNKKEHIMIDGVLTKTCHVCNSHKPLSEFGKYKSRWDGLNPACKKCHAARKKEKYPYRAMSEEKRKESYQNRKESFSKAQKERFKDPKERQRIRNLNKRPIVGTCVNTLKTIKFESAIKAREAGFHNVSVSRACKSGKPYKGYYWKKVK